MNPCYVRKDGKLIRKGSINLTRDEFTVKAFGLNRRKLAEARERRGASGDFGRAARCRKPCPSLCRSAETCGNFLVD